MAKYKRQLRSTSNFVKADSLPFPLPVYPTACVPRCLGGYGRLPPTDLTRNVAGKAALVDTEALTPPPPTSSNTYSSKDLGK